MKKYIKPNFKISKIRTEDIIATSIPLTSSPFKKGNNLPSAGSTFFKNEWVN